MVDLSAYVSFDPEEVGITELVYYPVLKDILEKAGDDEEELKAELRRNVHVACSEMHHKGRYPCFHQLQYAP